VAEANSKTSRVFHKPMMQGTDVYGTQMKNRTIENKHKTIKLKVMTGAPCWCLYRTEQFLKCSKERYSGREETYSSGICFGRVGDGGCAWLSCFHP
jgi:hypothetical protein